MTRAKRTRTPAAVTTAVHLALVLTSVGIASSAGVPSEGARQAARPNVLLIAVDDLNHWIGPSGSRRTTTMCSGTFRARVLEHGGYETRGVVHGGPGFFAPAAQDVLVAKVKELAAKAGRGRCCS